MCLFLYKQHSKYLKHKIKVTIMKQRLVYIDVLRGICIFVVAYTHIVQFCINDAPKTGIHQFLTLLFLQMFFFISGFVGYKDSEKWSLSDFKVFLLKKINTLFIPTICSMSLYQVVTKGSLDALWNLGGVFFVPSKGGYWFTVALFLIEIVYGGIMVVACHFKERKVVNCILLIGMLAAYLLNKTSLPKGCVADVFCLSGVLYYFPLFLFGVLCRKEHDIFQKLIINRWIQLVLLGVLVVSLTTNLVPLIVQSVVICLVAYYVVKDFCEKENNEVIVGSLARKAVSMLSVIGRYTLQIYFLHFMLLFRLPNSVCVYLEQSHVQTCYGHAFSNVMEFMIIGSCSLLLCLLSIGVSLIIKQLPFCHKLLFGK